MDHFTLAIEAHVDSVAWKALETETEIQITCYVQDVVKEGVVRQVVRDAAEYAGFPVPEIEFSRIPPQNWVAQNIKQFLPVTAGRFFVHNIDRQHSEPYAKFMLRVPAGEAFGTGGHGSTKGCLLALDRLRDKQIRTALDMGCGSGILSLAIARRWKCKVDASDIDAIAGRITLGNASVNGLRRFLVVHTGPGYQNRRLKNRQYDLIVSNILARPLMHLSRALSLRVAPGGVAILAGLLVTQEAQIISTHRRHGLHLDCRIEVEGWSTLVFRRRS